MRNPSEFDQLDTVDRLLRSKSPRHEFKTLERRMSKADLQHCLKKAVSVAKHSAQNEYINRDQPYRIRELVERVER